MADIFSLMNKSQLTDMANIKAIPSNVLVLSESILGQGNFVTQFQQQFDAQPTVITSIFGGNHIATALAEMCDDIYIPSTEGNALVNSNDLTVFTTIGWQNPSTYTTITKQYQKDGTLWNKIVKNDTTAYKGLQYNGLKYPTGATGVFVSFELYIPLTATPSPINSIGVQFTNQVTSIQAVQQVTGLIAGKKYKLAFWFPSSSITWTAGANEEIRMFIQLNRNATPVNHDTGTCYIKNAELSFFATGYTRYIPTSATAVAEQAVTMVKENKTMYLHKDVDTVIISYGRNEANDGVSAYSHYRAYDKLISKCIRLGQTVIPGNPPPRYDATLGYTVTDNYNNDNENRFDSYWQKLISKWNNGINVWQYFRDLVSQGKYTATQLMSDSWHQNTTGSTEVAKLYANMIKNRKSTSNCLPELKNNVKYYHLGLMTGTWVSAYAPNGIESHILSNVNTCVTSSTQNDYIVFNNVEAEQLHIIYRSSTGYGTFDIIVDEGTANQRIFSFNSGAGAEAMHGNFVCDFLDNTLHTVKIKITSTGLPVKIHGIVAI